MHFSQLLGGLVYSRRSAAGLKAGLQPWVHALPACGGDPEVSAKLRGDPQT